MARFAERDRRPVDAAVEQWKGDCLVQGESLLFVGEQIWTSGHLAELQRAFVDSEPDGKASFEEKLSGQLTDVSDGAVRLMAEVMAVYLLFAVPTSVSGPRKRELVGGVLGLRGGVLPESHITKAFDTGIGGPGQAYNSRRPDLLKYLIRFAGRFRGLDESTQAALLEEPWQFRAWLVGEDDRADGGSQMMRHIMLHLLFPETFERIAVGDDKEAIVEAFDPLLVDVAPYAESEDNIDERLSAIRERVGELLPDGQEQLAGAIDFYYSPLREGWDERDRNHDGEHGLTHLNALKFKRQVILYGPPGTGKTREAKELASRLIKRHALEHWKTKYLEQADALTSVTRSQIRRLQLHQNYSYEDFVWGMRLGDSGETVPHAGYLLDLVAEINAANATPPIEGLAPLPWVLIMDELNRVDLSRLLGECFSLLEDRSEPADLPMLDADGNRRSLTLPDNLFLIGTMNLIDQSVEQLDFALRRRFLWLKSGFSPEAIAPEVQRRWEDDSNKPLNHWHTWDRISPDIDHLVSRAVALNENIRKPGLLGEQYELGHSYFLDVGAFIRAWSRVKQRGDGNRPNGYLWDKGKPVQPLFDLWNYSLEPLLADYLSGLEPQTAREALKSLRTTFFEAPPEP